MIDQDGVTITGEQIASAGAWLGAAALGVGGLFGWILRHSMTRGDKAQDKLSEAVDALTKAVQLWSNRDIEERSAREAMVTEQREIAATLREVALGLARAMPPTQAARV